MCWFWLKIVFMFLLSCCFWLLMLRILFFCVRNLSVSVFVGIIIVWCLCCVFVNRVSMVWMWLLWWLLLECCGCSRLCRWWIFLFRMVLIFWMCWIMCLVSMLFKLNFCCIGLLLSFWWVDKVCLDCWVWMVWYLGGVYEFCVNCYNIFKCFYGIE